MAKDEVRWLEPHERDAWIALTALTEVLPSAVDAQLKRDAGLNRFEYMIMAGLSESECRSQLMSDIARFASGSISRASHAVTRLEGQGYVERHPYEADGRHIEVRLTDKGLAKMAEAAPQHVCEARRLVIDRLTPAQLSQLNRIARTLVAGVDPDLAAILPSS
jgi:DNA-binding MarR family transcriptional regulator